MVRTKLIPFEFIIQLNQWQIMRGGVPITRTKGEQQEKEIEELVDWMKPEGVGRGNEERFSWKIPILQWRGLRNT